MVLNGKMIYQDLMKNLIKNYDKSSDQGYFLKVDIEYPKQLWSSHKDLIVFT